VLESLVDQASLHVALIQKFCPLVSLAAHHTVLQLYSPPTLFEMTAFIVISIDTGSHSLRRLTAPSCFTLDFFFRIFHHFLAAEVCFRLGIGL